MPPNTASPTGVLYETDNQIPVQEVVAAMKSDENYKPKVLWLNVSLYSFLHVCVAYAIYAMFTSARVYTIIFECVMYVLAKLGITAGVHRLWAHRSYKAKAPLRVMLTIFNTLAFQDAIIHWSRDHRLHHKYSDTDADPHNAKRGIFFCHMGWLLCRKHPLVSAKGKKIDLSDLYADPILKFQKKYYLLLALVITFIIPISTPMYLWHESFVNAFTMNLLRFAVNLHATWLVNSAAHMFGNKPYDKYLSGSQNWAVSMLALGEGWHNYHHAFPWDYKAAEFGMYRLNVTAGFIDLMAKIGWAYELKSVSPDMIKKRARRTGDGSYHLWGWSDKDLPEDEKGDALVSYTDN